jgi:hypothetical protein
MDLSNYLANRRWIKRTFPFPHTVAKNVFHEPVFDEMVTAFRGIVDRGLSSDPNLNSFSRTIVGYDAFALNFSEDLPGPLRIFVSKQWHEMIARFTEVNATGDVNGGFHHHVVGSANGKVHNDFNPGWFASEATADKVNLSNHSQCNYQTGKTRELGIEVRETVRAVAILFYLNNSGWRVGDGGETGLYADAQTPVDRPTVAIPPADNSLLLFECTPYSYHAFISNRKRPRSSVIMWLHRSKEDAVARWGERSIVKWMR